MSSPETISSRSSLDSESATPATSSQTLNTRHDAYESRRHYLGPLSQRPLPDLPRDSESSHRGQMVLDSPRDSAVSLLSSDQTAEDRRRSIIALDRKRRLTNSTSEEGRRANAGGFHNRRIHHDTNQMDTPSTPPRDRATLGLDGSAAEVVDLTASSPPSQTETPRANRLRRTSSSSSRRYVVPRWQPDSEVSECPICKRSFTWMFRRHHCRKCGRVVCNDCSPHRITIPRQFIVHPPGPELATLPTHSTSRHVGLVELDDGDDRGDNQMGSPSSPERHFGTSQLEGGEKVRLCNPCVPDPQPDPFPHLPPFDAEFARDAIPYRPSPSPTSRAGHARASSLEAGSLSLGMGRRLWSSSMDGPQRRPPAGTNPAGRGLVHTPDNGPPWLGPYRSHTPATAARDYGQGSPHITGLRPSSLSARGYPPQEPRSLHALSRPYFAESRQPRDDVPSLRTGSLDNSRTYSSSSASRELPHARPERLTRHLQHLVGSSGPRLDERDMCPVCRHALPPRGVDGDEAARESHIMECIRARDPSYQADSEGGGSSQMRVHMLPFTATEKDCLGQDGNAQECSICMVEYEVGDELARLECLCKFHKECIVEWLGRKAECPVHKLMA